MSLKFIKIGLGCIFAIVLIAMTIQLKKQKIFLAGDSTMAVKTKERYPETGWGQLFGTYFSYDVEIINLASNGASTKTFINETKWEKLINEVSEGDYVFIEFGHNDEKLNISPKGTTLKEFELNLLKFVKDVKQKKAIPVLLTPLMRRSIKDGKFYDSHGFYPDVVRKVAKAENVALIDMLERSKVLLQNTGVNESAKFFLHGTVGEFPNFPNGIIDNSHFNEFGASEMAKLAIDGIKDLNLQLATYIKKK